MVFFLFQFSLLLHTLIYNQRTNKYFFAQKLSPDNLFDLFVNMSGIVISWKAHRQHLNYDWPHIVNITSIYLLFLTSNKLKD